MNNLQGSQKDMEKEITQLESFIKSDIDARELKRAIAVRMALEGKLYYEISKMLSVSEFFVGYWKKIFKSQAVEGIKLGYKGSQGYLTERQTDVVVEWLKNKETWNLEELVTYVEQEFGVSYKSKQSYYELFAAANIRWKKSQKINPKSDD
ncbi:MULTISPECIES: winged helix-turn-helix domain-containing protein [unclassified Microcoleus]|uniref:winged helix-turn-helix domain-containing protein n=1 Tax=unclassified Microcoleus TaxID=2642155 RepID=UPI002FCE7081